jgi:hypothetical protein
MPFDASGNFTRNYNFVQDAANGIKILAARVDGEFDNIATGMNAVFFRDGRVPMQADLRMNINGITGLKDGALGSPAIKFNTDPNTGPYLPGLNQYGIMVNSIQRGVFTASGLDVFGNLTGTAIFENGTSLGAKYAAINSPALTGVPTAPTAAGGTNTTQLATTAFVQGVLASPAFTGVPTAPTAAAGTSTTQLATTAFVTANYVLNTGGTYTGAVTLGGGATAGSSVSPGAVFAINSASGQVRALQFQTAGVFAADIQLQPDNGTIKHNSATAHRFDVAGGQQVVINSSGLSAMNGALILGHTSNSVSYGFSQNKAVNPGQVAYHLYNGGGVAEWVAYQPPGATGHEYRIGTYAAGVITDKFKIATNGDVTIVGGATLGGTPAVGDNTTAVATTAFVRTARNPVGQTIASTATATPTFNDDFVEITAQAAALNFANPTGTAVNMWGIVIRVKDDGTARALTYGTQYRAVGTALPTTTVAGKTTVLGMIFNSALTKWDVVTVGQE